MESKPFYKSKTFWVNALGLVVMMIPVLSDYELVKPEIAGLVLGVANVILRFISNEPVAFLAKKND